MSPQLSPQPPLTADEFAEIANVSRETLASLRLYADHLTKWQRALNLVAASTLDDLWRRHMLDSAQLVPHLPDRARAITDLGSGAGFPGLVLAILTGLPTELVEADTRKCAFLREAARLTGAPATVVNARIESLIAPGNPGRAGTTVDIVTARALAPLENLCEFAQALGSRAGVFLKGARWAEELTEARKSWNMTVETFGSVTSPDGRILRVTALARKREGRPPEGA